MKIAVIGLGYIGLANAILLSERSDVAAVDISPERREKIAGGISPIKDPEIESALKKGLPRLTVTAHADEACKDADFIVVAVPTDSAGDGCGFDTSVVEAVAGAAVKANPHAAVVLRSTLPIGYTDGFVARHPGAKVIFVPEFSREGHSLYDCIYPSRLVVGVPAAAPELTEKAREFAGLLMEGVRAEGVPIMFTGAAEAEAVKLFANTYLAMRIGFFNELDSFAEAKGLNTRQIIDGLSKDPRIGGHYNNPSFGYGGNCLPKDSNQLLSDYAGVPNSLIRAVSESNALRKGFAAERIIKLSGGKTVGIYRLAMKKGSDNFRRSAVHDIISALSAAGVPVVIYEPECSGREFDGVPVIAALEKFKACSALIVANRWDEQLADVSGKVYTRDIFSRD